MTRRRAMALGVMGAVCAVGATAGAAEAKELRVRGLIPNWGLWRPHALAGPYFTARNAQQRQMARDMAEIVGGILRNSGFKLVGAVENDTLDVDTVPRFADWRFADLLIVGRIADVPNGRVELKCRVWEVARGAQIIGRSLTASAEKWQRLAYAAAADIYEGLDD